MRTKEEAGSSAKGWKAVDTERCESAGVDGGMCDEEYMNDVAGRSEVAGPALASPGRVPNGLADVLPVSVVRVCDSAGLSGGKTESGSDTGASTAPRFVSGADPSSAAIAWMPPRPSTMGWRVRNTVLSDVICVPGGMVSSTTS
jgi:hypothetical protein